MNLVNRAKSVRRKDLYPKAEWTMNENEIWPEINNDLSV